MILLACTVLKREELSIRRLLHTHILTHNPCHNKSMCKLGNNHLLPLTENYESYQHLQMWFDKNAPKGRFKFNLAGSSRLLPC